MALFPTQYHRFYFYAWIGVLLCFQCVPSLGRHSPLLSGATLRAAYKQTEQPLGSSKVDASSDLGSDLGIDEDLYSRQLLVHGKALQQSLLQSHVTIIGNG
jgi:hypothetical protein